MKRKILTLPVLMVLGIFSVPAWAQTPFPGQPQPILQPQPDLQPLGPPAGAPSPSPFATQPQSTFVPPPPFTPFTQPQFVPPPPSLPSQPLPPYSVPPAQPVVPVIDPFGIVHSGWSVGIGAYFMEPVFQSNPAFINSHINGSGVAVFHQTEFNQQFTVAPQAWIAYTWASGWGIRGRWFEFSSTGNASGTVGNNGIAAPGLIVNVGAATAGDPINASSVLYGDVIDLEVTYTMGGERWWLTASAGVRYVHLNQSYSLNIPDPTNGPTNIYSVNNFDGSGPTVSLEGHHQLGWSNFGLYGSVRGSIVVGESHQWATDSDPVYGNLAAGGHQTSVLCIGEIEMGVEWSRRIGRFQPFLQLGGMGQIWGGGGNPSQALSAYTTGITPGSNFGFIGASLKGGINF
jgi:hypothetical protein